MDEFKEAGQEPLFMPLPFGGGSVRVYGGPYYYRPLSMTGVKLAQEINLPCDINLPIADYSIPRPDLARRALLASIDALERGESLYVGCMGGKGRTGLFMALLAKAAGVEHPIEHVRSTYFEHAVETLEQERFVKAFDVAQARQAYEDASARARLLLSADPKPAAPAAAKPF